MLLLYEFDNFNLREKYSSVWDRKDKSGFALGSGGAFLVIESKAHAEARGAKPFARLKTVVADRARRKDGGEVTASLDKLWTNVGAGEQNTAIITGATGAEPATSEELSFLKKHADVPVRATGSSFGHAVETQFPLGIGLAALSLSRGALYAPNDSTGTEIEMSKAPSQIVVIGTGHWRGEGMALVEAI
jgi:3-oxoacyl-[acyl-carrier-protein] synthase II